MSSVPRTWFFCLLTGVGYSLSASNLLEGFPWGVLAWVVLLPLHRVLIDTTERQAFRRGWLAGFFAFVGTMYWVVIAMHLYGKVPLPVSFALMVLLAAYLGLYFGAYAWGFVWLERRWPAMAWVLAPCWWVSLEFVRTYALSGLPWGLLGYSQFQWLPLIQIANITGVYGVSFLIVLVNVSVFFLLRWMVAVRGEAGKREGGVATGPDGLPRPWVPLVVAAAAVLVVWLYGMSQLTFPPSPTLTVGIVQANIDQALKWDEAYRLETLARYDRLTKTVSPDADVILWPEAATPFLFAREVGYQSLVAETVRDAQVPLVFGSPALGRHADGRTALLNSAYVLSPDGHVTGRYDKQHLVPFGEYIPLKSVLFFLDKLVEGIGDFQPGPGPTLLSIPHEAGQVPFGVAICYEVIFPDLVRRLAATGASFLVTLTNDAWFGSTVAPSQHFAMVVFRAVEHRLAFARAANTGISGVIDPTGRILAATPLFAERTLTRTIPLGAPTTFYTRFGDVFAWTCVILSLFLLLLTRLLRNRRIAD